MDKEFSNKIISWLPYAQPFLFVDEIQHIDNSSIIGSYTFKKDEYFYKGHFKGNPITPGVILLEVMGQIGLVCFGIYLFQFPENEISFSPILSNLEADFHNKVLPGETVFVHSELIYFRHNSLKCKIRLSNKIDLTIATTIAGCKFIKNEL